MFTQAYIVSDLELRLSKSKPSQDLDITYEQMAYWIDQARDMVTKDYVDKSKTVDSSLIMRLENLPSYDVNGDLFVDLGLIPLDIRNNGAIVYVEDDSGNFLHGSSQANRKFLSKMSFTKPSACTVVYTLNGSSLMINGGSGNPLTTYNVGLVHSEVSRVKEPDDKYYIAPSTLQMVIELAEEIGLRELNGQGFYDITNDGKGNNIT